MKHFKLDYNNTIEHMYVMNGVQIKEGYSLMFTGGL